MNGNDSGATTVQPQARESQTRLREEGRPHLEEAGRPLLEVAECTRAGLTLPTGVAGTPLCWVLGALEAKPHHPPQRHLPCSGSTPAGRQREG